MFVQYYTVKTAFSCVGMHCIYVPCWGVGYLFVTGRTTDIFTVLHSECCFYDFFMELILGNKVFSFRNEQYAMIYKTKNLVGIQIIPEEY